MRGFRDLPGRRIGLSLALAASLALGCAGGAAHAQSPPAPSSAVVVDPPRDKAHPAAMADVRIASGGSAMNGVLYLPAGAAPRPVLLLLHGFPGNERNFDLAQAARRQGWAVLVFHYRGSSGSVGDFSFAHVIEDARAAAGWLRRPDITAAYRLDPARLVIAGHSMGGFAAIKAATSIPIAGLALLDPWNIAADIRGKPLADVEAIMADSVRPLSGTSPEALAAEALAAGDRYDLLHDAPALTRAPLLVIGASERYGAESTAIADAVRRAGGKAVTARTMETDHSFNDHRIALADTLLRWLSQFEGKAP